MRAYTLRIGQLCWYVRKGERPLTLSVIATAGWAEGADFVGIAKRLKMTNFLFT